MSTNELLLKALRGEGQAHFDGKVRDRRTIGALLIAGHDAIKALQAECLEQARLNGMGSEREAALMAKVEALQAENDRMRAALTETEHWKRTRICSAS